MNLENGFSDRTVAAGKISFGLPRTNILKATINWSQDFRSISPTPSLIGIRNAAKLRASIEAARQRARIRKHSLDKSDSLRNAANPGKINWHTD